MLRRSTPDASLDAKGFDIAGVLASDVEVFQIRADYQSVLKDSFQCAVTARSDKDRTVLRLHVIDGLSIDVIGVVYDVHRATVALWLVRIRDELHDRTRRELMARVRIADAEIRKPGRKAREPTQ